MYAVYIQLGVIRVIWANCLFSWKIFSALPVKCLPVLLRMSMKRLHPAYITTYRTMHFIPRNVSVRPHQVSHCVRIFDALLRNNLYRFFIRCASSSSFFIRSLQMSDAFYKSSFFLNYSTLLYDSYQLQ